jgi:hypothetical protein
MLAHLDHFAVIRQYEEGLTNGILKPEHPTIPFYYDGEKAVCSMPWTVLA